MRFEQTSLLGAFVLEIQAHTDERGFFARTFSADEFVKQGLEPAVVQCSVSFNRERGHFGECTFRVPPTRRRGWFAAPRVGSLT